MITVLANPQRFLAFSRVAAPILGAVAVVLAVAGLWLGWSVPPDYQQGATVRLLFVHLPSVFTGMMAYACLAGSAFFGLVFRHSLADAAARAVAPLGAAFTLLGLITGAFWGRPMWGAWWVWDARLTSELILLFLYIGFMTLQSAITDPRRADRAGAVLALVGVVNIPIIYFSVKWWNTLHQGASVSLTAAPSMAAVMLTGMLLVTLGAWAYTFAAALSRVRSIILERERRSPWLKEAA